MADKIYKLEFTLNDGRKKEVQFVSPQGKSAYQYAKDGGYTGTEEQFMMQMVAGLGGTNGVAARLGEITLLASAWEDKGDRFAQKVNVAGVTANSRVDLCFNTDQIVIFCEKDLAFVTENDGGNVTVYAIGQKPTNDYTVQVSITEVQYE